MGSLVGIFGGIGSPSPAGGIVGGQAQSQQANNALAAAAQAQMNQAMQQMAANMTARMFPLPTDTRSMDEHLAERIQQIGSIQDVQYLVPGRRMDQLGSAFDFKLQKRKPLYLRNKTQL